MTALDRGVEPKAPAITVDDKQDAQTTAWVVAISVLLAAAGQYLLIVLPEDILPAWPWIVSLKPMWPHAAPALVAALLFVAAAALAGWSLPRIAPVLVERAAGPSGLTFGWRSRVMVRVVAVGAPLLLAVDTLLATQPYEPIYPLLIAGATVAILIGTAWPERRQILRMIQIRRATVPAPEASYVVGMVGAYILLCRFDLSSWYYSAIGDEYAFYEASLNVARGHVANLFSQAGAYDIIPVMSSFVEGSLMRVLGRDVVGWKMSIILPTALALVLTYALARTLFERRVAILTLGFLATAHYLLAYSHTGYPNVETLLPTVAAFLCFRLGVKRRLVSMLFLAGVFAGLGWYTYYPSRLAIGILVIGILLTVQRRAWLDVGAWVLSGFLPVFLPLAAVSKVELVTRMFEQTGAGSTTEAAQSKALLPIWNLGRTLLAFNYNTHDGPYLLGSLLEPVSATLFILGLGYVMATRRDARSRFLLVWFVTGVIGTGVLSKYDYVSVSRLNFLLPLVTMIAALACDRLLAAAARVITTQPSQAASVSVGPRSRVRFVEAVVVAIILISTYANLYRWFVQAPSSVPSTPDALALRVIELPICQSASKAPLVVDVGIGGAMGPAIEAMSSGIVRPEFALYRDPPSWIESAGSRCVIFRDPHSPDATRLMNVLEGVAGMGPPVDENDYSGQRTVVVFYPNRAN